MTEISIIIPTFNRADCLTAALKSFVSQNFPIEAFEILVVDNGSTDRTREIVETAISDYSHHIHYIYEPEPGLLSGRHRGALKASGEILIFVDDDIQADQNWLSAIHTTFTDASVQLVGGRNLPNYEVAPPNWVDFFWDRHPYGSLCGYLSLLDFGEQIREIDANYIWGLNFSIRKAALFELGGFHPDTVPAHLQRFQGDGESGLTAKANERGCKAVYQPDALIFHFVPKQRMTHEYFTRRSFFQGVCNSYTDVRKFKDKPQELKIQSDQPAELKLLDKLKTPFRQIKQKLLQPRSKLTEKEVLKNRFNEALYQGYQFHQTQIQQHPELLEWIFKEDYWNYKLPTTFERS